jgi:hypothetical protein
VFDDPGFIYELKHDGFRAIAYTEVGVCRPVSRRSGGPPSAPAQCSATNDSRSERNLEGIAQ